MPPAVLLAAWLAVGERKVKTDTDTTKSPESSQCVQSVCKSEKVRERVDGEQSETYRNKERENKRESGMYDRKVVF